MVIHSLLSKMLYAGWHVAVAVPAVQLRSGTELMYCGGDRDLAEMDLAFALVIELASGAQARQFRPDQPKERRPHLAIRCFMKT